MQHAVDPELAARADTRTGEQRNSGREETFVFDPGAVQVGVRAYKHGITDVKRVVCTSAKEGVFHDDHLRSDDDWTEITVEHCMVQDPAVRTDGDITCDDGAGSNPCGRIYLSHPARLIG